MLVKGKIQGLDYKIDLDLSLLAKGRKERRQNLIQEMNELEKANITCRNCPGTCCTFVGNSMQPTVLEAIDLYLHLKDENMWNDDLIKKLEDCIRDFRLHIRPSTGRGVYMRKSYTCPFFGHQSLGCPISPEAKPYGCLGFNATEKEEESGKSCSSNLEALKEREEIFHYSFSFEDKTFTLGEEELSLALQEALGLPWHKESIPVALLDLDRVWASS